MKINRLETHDRLQHFVKDQSRVISQGAEDCLKVNPLSRRLQDRSPYVYIFYHVRTLGMDEKLKLFASGNYKEFAEIPEKVGLWQPRLTKPEAQTNSYLFRATSHTDILQIIWMLPPEDMWKQYRKGNVTEHETVLWSISQYLHNKKNLEAKDPDDLPDERVKQIYLAIAKEAEPKKFEMI